MKRVLSVVLCLLFVLGAFPVAVSAEDSAEFDGIIEISSWDEFKAAFADLPDYAFGNYRMVLMKDLLLDTIDCEPVGYREAWISVWIVGNNVEFDFNGHTLSCVDDISNTTSKFIEIRVCNFDLTTGSTLRFMDSVGGGGISMISPRVIDDEIAAIVVTTEDNCKIGGFYKRIEENNNKLIIDGGNYTLETSTEKYGSGSTLSSGIKYRGTFIAHNMHTVINDGCFEAKGSGYVYDGVDTCTRELTAFGTTRFGNTYDNWQSLVINGGMFKSVGYSVHNFDEGVNNINGITGSLDNQLIPEINGGLFAGGIGFIGHTFAYTVSHSNTQQMGYSKLAEYPASGMIKNLSATAIMSRDDKFIDLDTATFEDLHNAKEVLVMNEDMLSLEFTPTADKENTTMLSYPVDKSETFSVNYELGKFIRDYVNYTIYMPYVHVRGSGETEWKEYDRVDSKTIEFANYPNGLEVLVGFKMFVARQEFIFTRLYSITVTEESGPANIITQPESIKVGVGELGGAVIEAKNVDSYQWQVELSGGGWVSITDDVAAMLMENGKIHLAGYQSRAFFIVSEELSAFKVRCVLTGTDGSETNSRTATVSFGDIPQVDKFYSNGYYADGDATFYLWGDMFEKVDWTVMYRSGSTTKFYTLDEFKAEKGIDYEAGFKLFGGVYRAVVTFKNVPESFSGKYSVGYSVSNSLGKVNFTPDNAVPFECLPELPAVTQMLIGTIGREGETLTFTFTSPDMTAADWRFESFDEDGVGVIHSIDEMKAAFPDSTFKTELKDGKATLTVTNADTAMNAYTLHAYAVGAKGTANAGSVNVKVYGVLVICKTGDVTGDGKVNSLDAAFVLRYDAGLTPFTYEQKIAADVTGDSKVNSLDAAFILRYDAGLIPDFPADK
ncbi:MAG: dockerin type I repeat-containing protein [Clostridia bacterium]|nr:dockerin type I repeat-containing protein [Clostridia bacterium]